MAALLGMERIEKKWIYLFFPFCLALSFIAHVSLVFGDSSLKNRVVNSSNYLFFDNLAAAKSSSLDPSIPLIRVGSLSGFLSLGPMKMIPLK